MSADYTRHEWPVSDTVEFRQTVPSGQSFRKALVYLIAGLSPQVAPRYRLRLEKYPEGIEPGEWYGGIVAWHCDSTDRKAVEAKAVAWVADGVRSR